MCSWLNVAYTLHLGRGLQNALVQAAYKEMIVFEIAAEALGQTTQRAATTDEKKDTSYMYTKTVLPDHNPCC